MNLKRSNMFHVELHMDIEQRVCRELVLTTAFLYSASSDFRAWSQGQRAAYFITWTGRSSANSQLRYALSFANYSGVVLTSMNFILVMQGRYGLSKTNINNLPLDNVRVVLQFGPDGRPRVERRRCQPQKNNSSLFICQCRLI